MEIAGTIKAITDIQTFASGLQKREMVIVTEEQYPQPISIEFLKEKGDLLNAYKEGDKVKVSINIGGREWTSPQGEVRYFNSITATVANRVADFRQVNDSIFGIDQAPNDKDQEYPHPEGLMPEIFYRLDKLFTTVELLMPEVKRISKLV